jgi:hypothetical protein
MAVPLCAQKSRGELQAEASTIVGVATPLRQDIGAKRKATDVSCDRIQELINSPSKLFEKYPSYEVIIVDLPVTPLDSKPKTVR